MKNMRLLVKILIAIVLGIGAGYIFPEWLSRAWATFNGIFSQFLGFLIPLLIVGFVAPAIAELGKSAGKMLAVTALIAYVMTFVVGIGSYAAANAIFPAILDGKLLVPAEQAGEVVATLPYFVVEMPPLMGVMSALVLAFVLGLGSASLKSMALRDVLNDFREVINRAIAGVIIPLLPFYIFGIFMNMTIIGQVGTVLSTFASIVAVIFVMHIAVLILQYLLASAFSGLPPFKSLKTMLPAYFTALGTQSSAATIPVTLRQTIACGVDSSVAGFVVPLCATIHMSGSTMKIVCCAIALMLLRDMPFDIGMFAGFIGMLAITIIAAPGVPGGAIMASLGLLSSILGFSEADCALMIALYIAMDSFGTACNITGDGAIAQIVGAIFRKK
ncbi:MAG: dicarboxylate/amino acid:cation symporter [Muribaculaceae bacterium]